MLKETAIYCNCKECAKSTRHEVIAEHKVDGDFNEYRDRTIWQIVRCLGCLHVSFHRIYEDHEQFWEDEFGEVTFSTTSSTYPKTLKNHKLIDLSWILPPVISKIYRQTLLAFSDEAYILAGVGLRASIEAVCNNLNISGSSLEKRIDQLFKSGYVSNEDKKRLHAIRFLGNDAAHEIKEPKESELRVALEIIEHLLNSVFILKKKAESLEITIENYDEFLKILAASAKQHQIGQAMNLQSILGRKRRLISQNTLSIFESQLIEDIKTKKLTYLNLDQIQKIENRDVQLFSIGDTTKITDTFDDDIPF